MVIYVCMPDIKGIDLAVRCVCGKVTRAYMHASGCIAVETTEELTEHEHEVVHDAIRCVGRHLVKLEM